MLDGCKAFGVGQEFIERLGIDVHFLGQLAFGSVGDFAAVGDDKPVERSLNRVEVGGHLGESTAESG